MGQEKNFNLRELLKRRGQKMAAGEVVLLCCSVLSRMFCFLRQWYCFCFPISSRLNSFPGISCLVA